MGTTTAAAPAEKKKDENADDPCHGKPKEFFIYSYDARTNVCMFSAEQSTFVACHYPDHYSSPANILDWLYEMAQYRDNLVYYESESYSASTTNTGRKQS